MEHALLGRGLGALEIVVERLGQGEDVQQETVQKLLGFFEVFGDRYHQIKEEHVLIPRLEDGCESRARSDAGSIVGEVYYEHEVRRRMLSGMQQAAEKLYDAKAPPMFAKVAADYIGFIRDQIVNEKNSLIRSASKRLATEDGVLERSFKAYAVRERIAEATKQFASEIDRIFADLSIVVPPAQHRAYSRGTIPYHRRVHSTPIRL